MPTLPRPSEDGRRSHGPSWWAADSTFPGSKLAASRRRRGTGVWRSLPRPHPSQSSVPESVEQAVLPHPLPVQDPDSAPLLPAGSVRAYTTRVLTTSAPSAPWPQQGKVLRPPGCGDRQHAPYLGGDCQPVLLLSGRAKPAPPGKGLSANSLLHHSGSGIPAPPRQKPTLAPPQRGLTHRGTQAGFSYAKAQAPPQRPCSYQEPSTNYHPLLQTLQHPPKLWVPAAVLLLPTHPAVLTPTSCSPLRQTPPSPLSNPASQSKKRHTTALR